MSQLKIEIQEGSWVRQLTFENGYTLEVRGLNGEAVNHAYQLFDGMYLLDDNGQFIYEQIHDLAQLADLVDEVESRLPRP